MRVRTTLTPLFPLFFAEFLWQRPESATNTPVASFRPPRETAGALKDPISAFGACNSRHKIIFGNCSVNRNFLSRRKRFGFSTQVEDFYFPTMRSDGKKLAIGRNRQRSETP